MNNQLDEFFRFKCQKGLDNRLQGTSLDRKGYQDRLDTEIEVITKLNFPGYFLIVQEFLAWCKDNNILTGWGRGSAAGSLCCWALGITNVDPIRYNLYFERFLNYARVSPPDVDCDIAEDKRDLVIQHLRDKYGSDRVAQIGTFGTFKAKKAIRDIARTLGYPLTIAANLCKLYPKAEHGKEIPLQRAIDTIPDLKYKLESSGPEGEILRWALQMEGRVSSFGTHAAGIVISDIDLVNTIPIAKSKNDEVVTQWDMKGVEEAGLIKFDLLGLKTLTVISTALELINKDRKDKLTLENIPVDDTDTYSMLSQGDLLGVFQLEASTGIRDLTVKVKPTCIEDISAINAIFRPGPLGQSQKMEAYLSWRAGNSDSQYLHPDLEPILKDTGGWLIYQESALTIAKELAGFTLSEADLLRRAIGKKDEKEMKRLKPLWLKGFKRNKYTDQLAEALWHELEAFADYSFNLSHAIAYSFTSYYTAYLKTHHPIEMMAALLTCDSNDQDKLILYIQECKRLGIPLLPPDVNESGLSFTPTGNSIRYGLYAIKNIGEGASHIIQERNNRGEFRDFYEFCSRVNLSIVNKLKLESLVKAGAFDYTHQTRATLLIAVEQVLSHKEETKRYLSKLETWEKKTLAAEVRLQDIKEGKLSEKGKPLKPLNIPEKPEVPSMPSYIESKELSLSERLVYEKELTGSFISGHPLAGIKSRKDTITIRHLKEDSEQPEFIRLLGIISNIEYKETKKDKNRMAFLKIEDLTGTVDCTVFPGIYNKYQHMIVENLPVYISAKVEYNDIESGEELVSIPALIGQKIELAESTYQKEDSYLDVKLNLDNIFKLQDLLSKQKTKEEQVKIKFTTESDTTLLSIEPVRIDNERKLRADFYKK